VKYCTSPFFYGDDKVIKKVSVLMLFCVSTMANAQLVMDNTNIKVETVDIDVLLETAPVKAQKQLLKNKSNLKQQLEQLYLKKKMARMAEQEGLAKDGINAVRLQAVIDNALFLLKLDQVKLSDNKDYSKVAKQIYQVNQEKYKVDARVDAAHILISTKKDLSEDESLKKAQSLRNELMLGADFNELALRESDDKTAQKNKGELGLFIHGRMVKPFSDAAFAMQEGEISEPVKTQFGYHLIKVNKKLPAGFKSFDEVKDGIIDGLKKKNWESRREDFYQKLKTDNKMEVDEDALDAYIKQKLEQL